MATKLDKDIVRESTVKVSDREILITLTDQQTIQMKLKGMKSGMVSISIEDLYNQLTGGETKQPEKGSITFQNEPKKSTKDNPLISLNDLRSNNMISDLDYPTKVKFEAIITSLIKGK